MSANGLLRVDELEVIDAEGTRLATPAAAVWRRMEADARADGVTLRPTPTTGTNRPKGFAGYRDRPAQRWLIDHPTGPVAGGAVGTQSHGTGWVLDVDRGLDWIVAHAARYGVTRPLLAAGEDWHIRFTKTLAQLGLDEAGPAPTRKKNDMHMVFVKADKPGDPQGFLRVGEFTAELFPGDAEHIPGEALTWGETLQLDLTALNEIGPAGYAQILRDLAENRAALASATGVPSASRLADAVADEFASRLTQ